MSKPGIFVYGYYGLGNFGDDLLALAVRERLGRDEPDAVFYFRCYGPIRPLTDSALGGNVFTPFEQELSRTRSKVFGILRYYFSHARLFGKCRKFVLGGGTLVHGNSSAKSLILLTALVALARLRGMDVVALGLGIGRLNGAVARVAAAALLWMCSRVCLRDKTSLLACHSLGIRRGVWLTDDLAYTLDWSKGHTDASRKGNVIAITLVEPVLNRGRFQLYKDRIIDELCGAIRHWIRSGICIRFVSCQEAPHAPRGAPSDRSVFEELQARLGTEGDGLEFKDLAVGQMEEAFAGVGLVLGMRFHAHLVSALRGIPFVGFSYDSKVEDLCNSYGMPYRPIEQIDSDWFLAAAQSACNLSISKETVYRHREAAEGNFLS